MSQNAQTVALACLPATDPQSATRRDADTQLSPLTEHTIAQSPTLQELRRPEPRDNQSPARNEVTSPEARLANAASLSAHVLLSALWRSNYLHHQLSTRSGKSGYFCNLPASQVGAAVRQALKQSAAGDDAYFAPAEFADSKNRTAANAACAHAFWLDIDCGPEKAAAGRGYESPDAALLALEAFCHHVNLPAATHVVDSGSGLHVYLALDRPVEREVWQANAIKLKALTSACGLQADPTRTADIASVLRVPNTLNYKYKPPRPVRLLQAAPEPLDRDAFLDAIGRAYDQYCTPPVRQKSAAVVGAVNGTVSLDDQADYGPPDLDRLASALKALEPDCDESTWKLARLAPMARAARKHPSLKDELRALARAWSSGELRGRPSRAWSAPGSSNGRTGKAEFDRTWNRFLNERYRGQSTTLGTIYHDALQAGWNYVRHI